mgnify:CR=1 FL=1
MLKGNLQKNQFDIKVCSILGMEENCLIDKYRLVILPSNLEPEPKKGSLNLTGENFDNLANRITTNDYCNKLVNTELTKLNKDGKNYIILHDTKNHRYVFLDEGLIPYNKKELFDLRFYTTNENYDFVLIVNEEKRETLYLLPVRISEKLDYLVEL